MVFFRLSSEPVFSFTSAPLGNALNTKYIILSGPIREMRLSTYLQHENLKAFDK